MSAVEASAQSVAALLTGNVLRLMMEVPHDLIYQNRRNDGSSIGSCRNCIINSIYSTADITEYSGLTKARLLRPMWTPFLHWCLSCVFRSFLPGAQKYAQSWPKASKGAQRSVMLHTSGVHASTLGPHSLLRQAPRAGRSSSDSRAAPPL